MLAKSRWGGFYFCRRIRQMPDWTNGPKATPCRVVNIFQDIQLGHLGMGA